MSYQRRRKMRFGLFWLEWAGLVLLCTLFFVAQMGYHYLQDPKRFAITSVEIKGEWRHVGKARIEAVSTPLLQAGFFGLDVKALQVALQQLPWVETVDISRVWPGKVVIQLTEYRPVARVNEHELLSENGVLFVPSPATMPHHLVRFKGPREKAALMWRTYVGMQKMLTPLSQSITAVELANRGAWKIELDHRMTMLLGREDVFIRLSHYVHVAPMLLRNREKEAKRLDLRYPNGMAIVWQDRSPQHAGT